MKNNCNYSDNWQPYIGDYDKFEYDIMLKDGTLVENCYPNAGKFNSISDEHDNQSFDENDVVQIRFSHRPRFEINYGVSSFTMTEEYKKRIEEQVIGKGEYDGQYKETKLKGTIVEVRSEPKIKRNQICICGSGLKYKKCCGKN